MRKHKSTKECEICPIKLIKAWPKDAQNCVFFSSCSHVLNYPLLLKDISSCHVSMMNFHPRNLFHQYLGSSDATMRRRTNYSPIPSPLHQPVPLSIPWVPAINDRDHMYLNLAPIIIIVIAGTTCIIFFLITLFKILRYYYPNRYNVSRSNPPILFDIRGDSPFSDDEEHDQAIRHPISVSYTHLTLPTNREV